MEVVNGYVCKNCTDVDYAKKNIDPAKPKDGPNGVYATDKAKAAEKSRDAAKPADGPVDRGPAVTLSGALANVTQVPRAEAQQPYKPGSGFTFTA
ncbi:hypothetical protein [Phenylobacterium sp.]|uniref:hypothetical protein n=1 Tax=Phenylobacterium sp. TaxID=1871053 RepID=UPI0025F0C88C|nr:hypothetical protein [Phenylobacterium sp.]